MVRRAAAMMQPTQDRAVLAQNLHPIDADIHTRAVVGLRVRRARDDEWPGDERRGFAWPAGLDRQAGEIDICAGQPDFLAGRMRDHLRARRQRRPHHRPARQRVLQAVDRRRLPQRGEQFAQFANALQLDAEPGCDAPLRAEQIGDDRHFRTRFAAAGVVEAQHRATRHERAPVYLRDLVDEIDRRIDTLQVSFLFEEGEKRTQVGKAGKIAKLHRACLFLVTLVRFDFGQGPFQPARSN